MQEKWSKCRDSNLEQTTEKGRKIEGGGGEEVKLLGVSCNDGLKETEI